MKKIPTLFQRDETTHQAIPEVTPGCEWVLAGEGVATRMWDGTACMVRDGELFRRFVISFEDMPEIETLSPPITPKGFERCQSDLDERTDEWPGWVPVGPHPVDQWHRAALATVPAKQIPRGAAYRSASKRPDPKPALEDGTYELCGPSIGGNPERFATHVLIRHGGHEVELHSGFFLRPKLAHPVAYHCLRIRKMEGIVWHHPDGRMAKIKAKDFGIQWPPS